jgi:hypothetical protein
MKLRIPEKGIAAGLLLLALVMIGGGWKREHKVYDQTGESFGIATFQRIGERQLIIDTTFGGTTRVGDKLYSTYDRTESRGKRSCPT